MSRDKARASVTTKKVATLDDLRPGLVILVTKAVSHKEAAVVPPSLDQWWGQQTPLPRESRELYGLPFRVLAIQHPFLVVGHPKAGGGGPKCVIDMRSGFEYTICDRKYLNALMKGASNEAERIAIEGPEGSWSP